MAKQIIFGDEARLRMFAGMGKINAAVTATLGPKGRNAIFSKGYGAPQVTNDGVTIAKEIELEDKVENLGAELIKEAASKTNDAAGDGTTTATLLAYAMIKEGLREVRSGINAVELKNGMKSAAAVVSTQLDKNAKKINGKAEIEQVATISAQDAEVGKIIADAMDKVGKDGVITIEEGQTVGLEVEVTEGMKFDTGYVSPYMITDGEKMVAKISDAPILITDKKISDIKDLLPLLEQLASQGKRDLFIVADDVDGSALTTLILNKLKGVLNVVAVKAPGFGDRKKEMLRDIAVLTGATVVSDELGNANWEKVGADVLGRAKSVTSAKDWTTIVGGQGDKKKIAARVAEIRVQIDSVKSDYDREKLQERLAKLAGGVAVIKVGAASETEMKERKLRIEDALNATKAAVEEGVVAGGGVALLQAAKALEGSKAINNDQQIGYQIVARALRYPVAKIAENAGKEGAVIVDKIWQSKDANWGYDAAKDEFVDLIKAGIIDPKKVERVALENAVSVAGMFLTTESVVFEAPKKDSCGSCATPSHGGGMGGMGGGMGGMGGMDY